MPDTTHRFIPRLTDEQLRQIQLDGLRYTLRQARNSPQYRARLDACGARAEDIRSLDDLRLLPTVDVEDLREGYPLPLLCVPEKDVVRIHASSGTTGKATVVGYTKRDIETWAECAARSLAAAGATANDIVQVSYGYGLFTGGLGAHGGAEYLGATVVPASGGATRRQAFLLRDFAATVLCCTPSYALHLWEAGQEAGIDFRDLPLRIGVFGAEPWTEAMRRDMEQKMGIDALNIYGLSEIMGPGVAMECVDAKCGMHLWEDHILPEIIDPISGEQLPPGEVGELVLTTLCRHGMPILRYRTRDLTRIIPGDCPCGRKHRRIDRILGRSDDMIIVKGVNIYPMQVERVLMAYPEVGQNYVIVLERDGLKDTMKVQVEIREESFVEDMRVLRGLQETIARALKDEILITPKVELVQHNSLPRTEGKAQRVIDKREKS